MFTVLLFGLVITLFGVGIATLQSRWLSLPKPVQPPLLASPAPFSHALPELAPPAPVRTLPPARKPTIFDLAGVLVVSRDREDMRVIVERDGIEYNVGAGYIDPVLRGTFLAVFKDGPPYTTCGYCGGDKVSIFRIVRVKPPVGAKDLGLVGCARVAKYCSNCGHRDEALTKTANTGPFGDAENLRDILKLMAAENGKLTKKIRWDMLSEEYGRLQPRVAAIGEEMNRLHAELWPRTDLDPYRGTPLAKLDDPPDNRAKALPALTGQD